MKFVLVCLVFSVCGLMSGAEVIELGLVDELTSTTGDQLDNMDVSGASAAVAEISGLDVTATFGADGSSVSYLNAINDRLGMNSDLADEGASLFDPGEWVELSFSSDVHVSVFKFTNFTDGDSVRVTRGSTVMTLGDADLNVFNEVAVDWEVSSEESILFEALGKSAPASTEGGFGLESMTVAVPEPVAASLIGIGGMLLLVIRRRLSS